MDVNTVVEYGSIIALAAFGGLLVLAQREHKRHLKELRKIQERLNRLGTMMKLLSEEKAGIAKQADDKVEKNALQLVITETSGALAQAMAARRSRFVARVAAAGGRR